MAGFQKKESKAKKMLGRIFGGKKEVAPNPQESITKLRETEDMLLKKQDYLEKKIQAVGFCFLWL